MYLLIQVKVFPTQGLKRRTSKQNLTSAGSGYRQRKAPNQVAPFCTHVERHDRKLNNPENRPKGLQKPFLSPKRSDSERRKAQGPKRFAPPKRSVGEQKKPDSFKNDSHHQKGVATNIIGLKAIKGFAQPKRSGNNSHNPEGMKSYSHHQKKTEASLTGVGARTCMFYKGQTKLRDTPMSGGKCFNPPQQS